MINDRDLNKSIGKARDLWLDSLDLPEGKEAPFSPEFEKNTLRLLKRSRLKHSLSRMFTACIIVALMLSATLYTVLAQPEGENSLYLITPKENNDGCIIGISSDGKGRRRNAIEIEPGFLPEGYKLTSYDMINNQVIFSFAYENDLISSYFSLDISITDLSGYDSNQSMKYFSGKDITIEEIEIHNCPGFYITDGSYKYLLWIENNYFVKIHSYLAKEEIVKTAQNLTVFESKK